MTGRWQPLVDYVEAGNPILTDGERDAILRRLNAPRGRQTLAEEAGVWWRRQVRPTNLAHPVQAELSPFARQIADKANGAHVAAFRRWRTRQEAA